MKIKGVNTSPPIIIDTDNALGSSFGDVDDAYALSLLIKSSLSIHSISSTHGNTSEQHSFNNTQTLQTQLKSHVPQQHGAQQAGDLPVLEYTLDNPVTYLALGPLSNLSALLKQQPEVTEHINEVLIIGGNREVKFRLPPFFPMEFNLTQDKAATTHVFSSDLKLTILPLDLARTFSFSFKELQKIQHTTVGTYLLQHSRRWYLRNKLLKFSDQFPIWDALGALYAIDPSLFTCEQWKVKLDNYTELNKTDKGRTINIITDYQFNQAKSLFFELLSQ